MKKKIQLNFVFPFQGEDRSLHIDVVDLQRRSRVGPRGDVGGGGRDGRRIRNFRFSHLPGGIC